MKSLTSSISKLHDPIKSTVTEMVSSSRHTADLTKRHQQLQALGHQLLQQSFNITLFHRYQQLLDTMPDAAQGYNDLATAMIHMGQPTRAEACFCKAIAFDPTQAHYHNNLGRLLRDTGRTQDAIGCYREALHLQPNYANAQWNLSLALLATGQYLEGWQRFVWRQQAQLDCILDSHQHDHKTWLGEPIPGQRLLVRYEQGLGDNIQLIRYLPLIKERVGSVVWETLPTLRPLFEGLDGLDELVDATPEGHPATHYDRHVFAFDLPRIFQTTLDSLPGQSPYLKADPKKVTLWKERLQGPERKIGIVWSGSPRHTLDRQRSCHLRHLYPLTELDNTLVFSLQKGPAVHQIRSAASRCFVDLCPFLHDFSDTAAIVANLDVVISVDTAVLHLAGALGQPAWALLPYVADWRWLLDRADSPWYPSLELFRQPNPGNWDAVINAVIQQLEQSPL